MSEKKSLDIIQKAMNIKQKKQKRILRGHSDLNQGPIDLQSIALPLSYTPAVVKGTIYRLFQHSSKVIRLIKLLIKYYYPHTKAVKALEIRV